MTQKYVVDTSIVIEKMVSKLIKNKEIKGTIIVPNAVVAELEAQANRGQEIGLLGLEELQELLVGPGRPGPTPRLAGVQRWRSIESALRPLAHARQGPAGAAVSTRRGSTRFGTEREPQQRTRGPSDPRSEV